MVKRLTFAQRVGQAGIVAGGIAGAFTGAIGRLPPTVLGIAAALSAAASIVVWIGLRLEKNRETDEHIAGSTCLVATILCALIALFGLGVLPGASQPAAVGGQARQQVDAVLASVTFQPPPVERFLNSRVIANDAQSNEIANQLRRELNLRARDARPASANGQPVDIAVTVEGGYSNLAAQEFRARAAANFRARENGFTCTLSLARDGRIEAVTRDLAEDIARQATQMMNGVQEC